MRTNAANLEIFNPKFTQTAKLIQKRMGEGSLMGFWLIRMLEIYIGKIPCGKSGEMIQDKVLVIIVDCVLNAHLETEDKMPTMDRVKSETLAAQHWAECQLFGAPGRPDLMQFPDMAAFEKNMEAAAPRKLFDDANPRFKRLKLELYRLYRLHMESVCLAGGLYAFLGIVEDYEVHGIAKWSAEA